MGNLGVAALSPDGQSANCVPRKFLRANKTEDDPVAEGMWNKPRPDQAVDRRIWNHRRAIALTIVSRGFSACSGFRSLPVDSCKRPADPGTPAAKGQRIQRKGRPVENDEAIGLNIADDR